MLYHTEILDFGYLQTTDPDILRMLITQKGVQTKVVYVQ